MTDKQEKDEIEVPADEIVGIIDAMKECQDKRKAAEKIVKEWQEAENTFKQSIIQWLLTHAERPAEVYHGTVNKRRRCKYMLIDVTNFDKTKFGEQYPDLLDQFTMLVPAASTRFTVK